MRNEYVFVDIDDIRDTETVETALDSHYIGSLQDIEVAVSRMLHCSCESMKLLIDSLIFV